MKKSKIDSAKSRTVKAAALATFTGAILALTACAMNGMGVLADSGAPGPSADDKKWRLPKEVPEPADNKTTPERVELGKVLFFDPRLSSERTTSCATCHNPSLGWSDALPTTKGFKGKVLLRASPTLVNSGYATIQQWDGKRDTLEGVVLGPVQNPDMMNMDSKRLVSWLDSNAGYKALFNAAYPGEAITGMTVAKALGAFQRSLIVNDTPFDRWLEGDRTAMTPQQVRGFRLFSDSNKGNCAACHSGPNFTDYGFHNIGLASFGAAKPDMGRFAIKPIPSMKGAFKTPTLRDIALTAPYFHDGSAATLTDVVEHYNQGGVVRTNVSNEVKPLNLSKDEVQDVVAFMHALHSKPPQSFAVPQLPIE